MQCKNMKFLIVLTYLFSSTSSNENTTEAPEQPEPDVRLPKSIRPLDYDLHVKHDYANNSFAGKVTITILVKEKTDTIKLHASSLLITSIQVNDEKWNKIEVEKCDNDTKRQFFIINLKEQLQSEQKYLIKLSFIGSLELGFDRNKFGYYKKTYKMNNQTVEYSLTKFEPGYARQAFPCFDEPSLKATFKLTLTHHKDLVALSNMPAEDQKIEGNNLTVTSFKRSPVKMSTYLMAWFVGNFTAYEDTTSRGIRIRFFAHPNETHQTEFVLNLTAKMLDFYDNYFDIPYPLPKLDFLQLQSFVTGGMENWGLVSLHGGLYLIEPKLATTYAKKKAGLTIGHELTHNWFGNLVTMAWWNDLWLNEGFTTFIEYKGLAAVKPQWNVEEHILIDRVQKVMRKDSLSSSHPIVHEVRYPDEVKRLFDDFTYDKGGSVNRMLEDTIGKEAYKKGIVNYLKKYKESNAESADLWAEMDEAVSQTTGQIKNVTEFMRTWITEKNFPLVNVEREKTGDGLIVRQNRFLMDSSKASSGLNNITWIIPIKIITKQKTKKFFVLNKEKETFKMKLPEDEWFKLNPGQFGYYVVNYAASDWKLLSDQLLQDPSALQPLDRANLIFDTFQLAKAHQMNYSFAFNLAVYLQGEDHLIPWATAINEIKLWELHSNDEVECLKLLMKHLAARIYQKLGWEDKREETGLINDKILRAKILDLACWSGHEHCLMEASANLKRLVNNLDDDEISPDARETVYKYGIKQSKSRQEFDWMMSRFQTLYSITGERSQLLTGLANIRDPELFRLLVDKLISNPDDTYLKEWLGKLKRDTDDQITRQLVWSLIKEKWSFFVDFYRKNDVTLAQFVSQFISWFDQRWQLEEVEEFFKQHPDGGPGTNSTVIWKQAIDKIRRRVDSSSPLRHWLMTNTGLGQSCLDWRPDDSVKKQRFSFWKCCRN